MQLGSTAGMVFYTDVHILWRIAGIRMGATSSPVPRTQPALGIHGNACVTACLPLNDCMTVDAPSLTCCHCHADALRLLSTQAGCHPTPGWQDGKDWPIPSAWVG